MSATAWRSGRRPRRFGGAISTQITGLALFSAAAAALVAVLFGVGFIRAVADGQVRQALIRQADALDVAVTSGDVKLQDAAPEPAEPGDTVDSVTVDSEVIFVPAGHVPDWIPVEPLRTAVLTGTASGVYGKPEMLIEIRLVPGGVIVVQAPLSAATDEIALPVLERLLWSLALGVLSALVAALGIARRISRPLVAAGSAAEQLAAGERNVRLDVDGPREVARVATAMNTLSDTLAASEDRQRRFLMSVSHELRTPLTSIRGYAEALDEGMIDSPEEAAEVGAILLAETRRLDGMITDLLSLARLDAAEFVLSMADADLVSIATQAEAAWREPCRRAGIPLSLELGCPAARLRTDPMRARQIIDALVANALRLTPAGRPIVIAVRPGPAPTTPEAQPTWVLEVRDGGPGLREEDFGVAFDRGVLYDRYRAVRPAGSGLGLAVVGSLAVRLGGGAVAGHAPEGGALFRITLPAGTATPAPTS